VNIFDHLMKVWWFSIGSWRIRDTLYSRKKELIIKPLWNVQFKNGRNPEKKMASYLMVLIRTCCF